MTQRSTDDPGLVSTVRTMRASGATYAQIKAELQVSASTVSQILGTRGSSHRPRISDDVKSRALALRRAGWSVPEIAHELGIAKSTAWQITKEIAWKPTPDRKAQAKRAARIRWDRFKARRAAERERIVDEMAVEVAELRDRELLLIGAVLYWAEGSKIKPWNSHERLTFINSDPDVIVVYLAWLRLVGVPADRLTFSVHIHETADVLGAERYWADLVGVQVESLGRTQIKRHKPKTARKNTGENYRGCLVVRVRGSGEEYRRMDGLWRGICKAVQRRTVTSV